jgi:hypothetical protein
LFFKKTKILREKTQAALSSLSPRGENKREKGAKKVDLKGVLSETRV